MKTRLNFISDPLIIILLGEKPSERSPLSHETKCLSYQQSIDFFKPLEPDVS